MVRLAVGPPGALARTFNRRLRRDTAPLRQRLPRQPGAGQHRHSEVADGRGRGLPRRLPPSLRANEPGRHDPGARRRHGRGLPADICPAYFDDQPTIEAMNLMGFEVGTLGNHEFDEGEETLLRQVSDADLPYVSTNVVYADTGELVLDPYAIVEQDGVKIGFIGVTTRSEEHTSELQSRQYLVCRLLL